jgi:TrmH family RNA methyltransferase
MQSFTDNTPAVIASRDNAKLKFAKRVREGKEPGLIFVEGTRAVVEAIRSKASVRQIFVSSGFASRTEEGDLGGEIAATGAEIVVVTDKLFDTLADTASPQGILLIAERPVEGRKLIEDTLLKPKGIPVVVYLHEVNNPSNLGAIVRTAEAAGAVGVATSVRSADAFSPAAIRGSMGSALRLPVWQHASITEIFGWAEERRLAITATAVEGTVPYYELDWHTPRLLVFGSEAHGLPREGRNRVRDTISIPMQPGVESLNLAVAAGVILFEARRNHVAMKGSTAAGRAMENP